MSNGLGRRILNFLIGEDEAINGLDGGRPDETISGTVGRAAAKGQWFAKHIAQPFINTLMRNPHHCQEAAATEEARRKALGKLEL